MDTDFISFVGFREKHGYTWGRDDFYYAYLKPKSHEIKIDTEEIEKAQWLDFEVVSGPALHCCGLQTSFASQPDVSLCDWWMAIFGCSLSDKHVHSSICLCRSLFATPVSIPLTSTWQRHCTADLRYGMGTIWRRGYFYPFLFSASGHKRARALQFMAKTLSKYDINSSVPFTSTWLQESIRPRIKRLKRHHSQNGGSDPGRAPFDTPMEVLAFSLKWYNTGMRLLSSTLHLCGCQLTHSARIARPFCSLHNV